MTQRIRILVLTTTTVISLLGCSGAEAPAKPSAARAVADPETPKEKTRDTKHAEATPGQTTRLDTPTLSAMAPPSAPASVVGGTLEPERPLPARVTKDESPSKPEDASDAPGNDRELDPASVKLERFVLTGAVEGHEPVGEAEVFPADTAKIFAFLHFANADGQPYQVKVHFESIDGPAQPYGIELDVGKGPRWRTWAYTRVRREPGTYRAVVRTPDGQDIASKTFEIIPAE